MKSRSSAVAWIVGLVVHGLLLVSAAWLYWFDLSGVPDDGQVPVPMLPAFLFSYSSGPGSSVWTWPMLPTWLLSCLAYVVAPAVVGVLSKRGARDASMFASALLLLAWLVLPAPGVAHTDSVPSFNASSRLVGMVWLVVLTTVGCGLGALIRARTATAEQP